MPALQSLTLDCEDQEPILWCPDLGLSSAFVLKQHAQFRICPELTQICFVLRSSSLSHPASSLSYMPGPHHFFIQVRQYRRMAPHSNLFHYRYSTAVTAGRPLRPSQYGIDKLTMSRMIKDLAVVAGKEISNPSLTMVYRASGVDMAWYKPARGLTLPDEAWNILSKEVRVQ